MYSPELLENVKNICPHCGKEIFIFLNKENKDQELEKKIAKATQGLRKEITSLRQKIKTNSQF